MPWIGIIVVGFSQVEIDALPILIDILMCQTSRLPYHIFILINEAKFSIGPDQEASVLKSSLLLLIT